MIFSKIVQVAFEISAKNRVSWLILERKIHLAGHSLRANWTKTIILGNTNGQISKYPLMIQVKKSNPV